MTEKRSITKEDVLLKTRLSSEGARLDVWIDAAGPDRAVVTEAD